MTELDPAQGKLLGALTLTALKHLDGDTVVFDADNDLCPGWRMARVGEIALVAKPTDDQSPPRIDCYRLVERSASGAAIKLDPACLIYSLQHNAQPPDFDLVLLQDEPQRWISTVIMTLLGELRRRAPHAIDWSPLQNDVVPMLDAFEAAQDGVPPSAH